MSDDLSNMQEQTMRVKNKRVLAVMVLAVGGAANCALAETKVERTENAVRIVFENGVKLDYALKAGQMLGLNKAEVEGVAMKSAKTLVRPVLVQEKGDKLLAMDTLRVMDVKVAGDVATISCNVFGTKVEDSFARLFVMKDGKPHLDFYLFPHLGLPSEVMKVETYEKLAEAVKPGGVRAGTLDIVVSPVTENVGGFVWKGWKHQYVLTLQNGRTLNCIREMGTWETQGEAAGNTIVALRYRGLGGLSEKLEGMEDGGKGVKNVFTTTEILPGAAGKGYAVSPVVPGPQNVKGREEAMVHRHGAWIAQPQRGAGSPFFDFQYSPTVGLTSFYEDMDSLRSLTEVWPGDEQISYTDCQYFPRASSHTTIPKVHMALVRKQPMAEHEWRTRYQEMDGFVREMICRKLDFVQHDPLPSVGLNWDSAWEWRLKEGTGKVEEWKAAGVKRVISHHPGWFNGRGLRQKETAYPIPQRMLVDPKKPDAPAAMQNDTGGDCSIHDYVPQSEKVKGLWVDFVKKMNANDMEYMAWITGMVYGTGPVVEKFGEKRFAINDPGVDYSSGYPGKDGRAGHRNISIRDPELLKWWESRMDAAIDELGVSGFWADSYQNLFMSSMNYQMADWSPNVRDWWKWIAKESRRGVAWMGESHSFPGLSCSIEVGNQKEGYEGEEWLLMYSTRWYRGSPVPFKGTEKADQIFFRTMANKGPIAPGDGNPGQIPSMGRMSREYMEALPLMRRPYQLPENKGVLWLSNDSDRAGVLFPFVDLKLAEGVSGCGILEVKGEMPTGIPPAAGSAAMKGEEVKAYQALYVTGKDLLAGFGLVRGEERDPRMGVKYVAPVRYMKNWSK